MQKFLVVLLVCVCLVGEISLAMAEGPKMHFSAQGQVMVGLEVEILGMGIKGRTDSEGNLGLSVLGERIEQKKISFGHSDKIKVLVKTLKEVPTQIIEFSMSELAVGPQIELKKTSTVREQANVLKVVGPSLRHYGGELIMSGVEILVLGDHSRDAVQSGVISLTPYIDDRDHFFTMVLVGNGYETKFVRVNIPRHKRGEEVFSAAKNDLTLMPDFFKPIALVLTAPPEFRLDSPVKGKKVEYFQSRDHFAVRVVLTTESESQYFGTFAFSKEGAGYYPLQESEEMPISESPAIDSVFAPLDDLRGVPNFVLTQDSLRFLKVAPSASPQAQSGPKTEGGLSFGMKFLIVCLLIVGLGVLLYVVQSLRIRKRESRAEAERALRQRYLDAGIDFLDRVNYALDRAGDTMSLASTQGVAQLLEEASGAVQKLLAHSLEIKADIDRLAGVLRSLNTFRRTLLETMRQHLKVRQYSQAKTIQGQIESIEAQIKQVEGAKTGLEESLQKNNKGLQDAVSFLSDLAQKIRLKEELEHLKAEVPQALQDFMGAMTVDQEAALKLDDLLEEAQSAQDLEAALREVEGEEEVTELAEVDKLAKFLEDREGGGRSK